MPSENFELPIPDPDKRPADRQSDSMNFKGRFEFWYNVYDRFATHKDSIAQTISKKKLPASNTLKHVNFPNYGLLCERLREELREFVSSISGEHPHPVEHEISDVLYWLAVIMASYRITYEQWKPDIFFKDQTYIPGRRVSTQARLEEICSNLDISSPQKAVVASEDILMFATDVLLEHGMIPRGIAYRVLNLDLEQMLEKEYLKDAFSMPEDKKPGESANGSRPSSE